MKSGGQDASPEVSSWCQQVRSVLGSGLQNMSLVGLKGMWLVKGAGWQRNATWRSAEGLGIIVLR